MNKNINNSNGTGATKQLVSNILSYNRDWHNEKDVKPAEGQPVVIRIVDPDPKNAAYENEKEILLMEDQKVAMFVRDYGNTTEGEWIIQPPYLKYDYSPLTNKDKIRPGAVITHWGPATDEELEGWRHRLDILNQYDHLRLEVDQEHEEGVYRACVWGSNLVSKEATRYKRAAEVKNDESLAEQAEMLNKLANILMDLQCCIDHGKGFVDGKFVSLHEEYEGDTSKSVLRRKSVQNEGKE